MSEEPGDQDGDRLTLLRALRPARRLPRGLLCTSTFCSFDLGKWRVSLLPPDPQGQGLGSWIGPGLSGAMASSEPATPSHTSLPKTLGSMMLELQNVMTPGGLECRDNGHSCAGPPGWQGPHIPQATGLDLQGFRRSLQ